MTPDKLLITPIEAAELCGVSRATIDNWSHRTGFPVIRQGRIVRLPLELFKSWLEAEALRTNEVARTPPEYINTSGVPVIPPWHRRA